MTCLKTRSLESPVRSLNHGLLGRKWNRLVVFCKDIGAGDVLPGRVFHLAEKALVGESLQLVCPVTRIRVR